MKILITGGTGFIGAQVIASLVAGGHEVQVVVRPNSDQRRLVAWRDRLHIIVGDILELDNLALRPELCVHLAWYVEPGQYLSSPRNLDYLTASLELARRLAVNGCRRFVGVGTCLEYVSSNEALHEDSPTHGGSLYATTKLATATVLQQYCATTAMEFVWARLFYQYGPMEDPRRLVPSVITRLLAGERAELTHGNLERDFLHVSDVGSALANIATGSLKGVVNVGSGRATAIREIAQTIGGLLGKPDLLDFAARSLSASDPPRVVADNRRLRETGWQARFDLVTGLEQTINWWKNHR